MPAGGWSYPRKSVQDEPVRDAAEPSPPVAPARRVLRTRAGDGRWAIRGGRFDVAPGQELNQPGREMRGTVIGPNTAEQKAGPMEATENGTGADQAARSVLGSVTAHIQALCEMCLRAMPVDGVSVVITSGSDHREMVHATDDIIARLDDLQFVLGEGPCVDAYRCGLPVLEPELNAGAAAHRWPGFAREATGAGAAAVFAFPLQVGAVPFGVLEMYRTTAGELDDGDVATALLLAEDIVRVMLHDLTDDRFAPAVPAEVSSLFGRGEIPQATGMVAVQLNLPISAALSELRAAAFARNRSMQSLAEDIVARRLNLAESE